MSHLKVFLIGMPSCGKSTLAKVLSEKIGLKMLDLDKEIIKIENQSINKIFRLKGEKYFREIESKVLSSLIKTNTSFIMATGGGTACFNQNINLINKSGLSIFIDLPIKELEKRLLNDNQRPLFNKNMILKNQLKKIYEKRKIYYEKSKHVISGDNIKTEKVVSIIRKFKS